MMKSGCTVEELVARLNAVARDARGAAAEAHDVAMEAMALLYRAAGEELPEGDSFLERMGGKAVAELVREKGLAPAFDYVRVLGSHALHEKHITKNAALAAVEKASEILAAVRAKVEPGAPAFKYAHPLTEAETRKEYIDLYLREAGWELAAADNTPAPCKAGTEIKVTGMPPNGQDGYCDYVLYGRDGLPQAVVEAKRTSASPEKGRQQVKLYGERLAAQYGCATPVLYYTNGYRIWCVDGLYPDRELGAYHRLGELEGLLFRRNRKPIHDFRIDRGIAGRPYQITAVTSLCEWFNALHRRGLLVMATGTGKTRVAVSLVDVLSRNDWVEHVLFLADRTELVDQARKVFAKQLPDMPLLVLNDKSDEGSPDAAKIVMSTYQTMIHAIDAEEKPFGIGHFDLIVTDEAHRSIFNKYGAIFEYFDALLVGLTATPRDEVDANTYRIFDCDVGVPNFEYSMEQGRKDGYLVGWKLKNCTTGVLRDGIRYDALSAAEKADYEEGFEAAGYDEAPDEVSNDKIFRAVYNAPTCDRVLEKLMEEGQKVESGELLGKTILFAYNHRHAQMVVERFHKLYPNLGADYCQLIDNQVKFAQSLITDFKNKREFRIAVSVDMLDTGVDVPEALNLVFFKKVRSKIKFFQMLGRGTRLAPDVFGPGLDKAHFLCFDWCGNFEYFGAGGEGEDDAKPALSVSQRIFSLRVGLMLALQDVRHQAVPWRAAYRQALGEAVLGQVAHLRRQRARIAVRKAMPHLDKFKAPEDWAVLTPERVKEVDHHIAPLVEDLQSEHELVKLFDAHMLGIELGLATHGEAQDIAKVRKVAKRLLKLGTIAEVVARRHELETLASQAFWEHATLEQVEELHQAVRGLMVYLKTDGVGIVTLHIADSRAEELPAPSGLLDIRTYREKVIDYLAEHMLTPVVDRIRKLQPIDASDMRMLEKLLWHTLGTKEQYEAEKYRGTLPGFVRSLVDIDDAAVQEKFGEFLSGGTLNSDQQEFVHEIIDYLRENGEVTADDLVNEEPFVNYDISGLFEDKLDIFRRLRDRLNAIWTVSGKTAADDGLDEAYTDFPAAADPSVAL